MNEDIFSLLIVDDDEVDRMAVTRSLRKSDLHLDLTQANTCGNALQLLEQKSFDCLLLDYRLPDGNALEFIRKLSKRDIRLPIIVLTGQGDEKIAVELMKAGASDYVAKSQIAPKLLSRSIQSAIRVYRAERKTELANQKLRQTNLLLKNQNQQLESQKQQIHLQNLQLIEASNLKSQFLASMSHELRTPMHAIMGFSQILLQGVKGELSPAQSKMVERILDNSKSLLDLLNDLLDFSKIEAGRLEMTCEEFNVAKLVVSTIEELRSLTDQKNLALNVDIVLEDRKLIGDEGRLKQVLVNLLSNAIKFTEAGQIMVKVSEADQDMVAIAVQDTGIGISPEQFETIFDAFRQVNQSVSRKYPGTGLGLAISKSLVEMMQGQISLESQLGEGTIFTVVLPRKISAIADSTAVAENMVVR